MKRVVIVRHAKAVPYGYNDDFNRDLSEPRGSNDAKKISSELRKYNVFPDLILSSPAKRALKTAKIYADTFEYPLDKIRVDEELYNGISSYEFVDRAKNIPDEMNVIYLFGHNPAIFYLIKGLVPGFNEEIPTCSSVVIDFETETWKKLESGKGKLVFQLSPGMYK
jgi:phosphohistidine phosphatase